MTDIQTDKHGQQIKFILVAEIYLNFKNFRISTVDKIIVTI